MGTVSSSLASTGSTTTSSSSSAASTFNGSSTYASDLQNAITRSVGFASLPLTQLQNHQNDLNSKQTALTSLSGQFQSLQTALDGINKSVSSQSNAVTVGSAAVASATVTNVADSANYSITVTNIGSTTNAMSADTLAKVTNPDTSNIDPSGTFKLTVDNATYNISDTSGTLTGLKDAINASAANVQATIINIGSSSAPDYRLSIQSTSFASTAISLSNGSQPLLNTLSTGSPAQYTINGAGATVSSSSRTITLAPGLSVNLQQPGTTTINVARSATSISTALSAFATAYNSAFDELAKSRGSTAGALSGDSVVYTASQSLQNLRDSASTSTATVNSLEDLGLTFGKDGHLTFDSSVLAGASSTKLRDAATFLGSTTSGGFLQGANNVLTNLDDSTTGLFVKSAQSITDELTSVGDKITTTQARITALQTSLTAQMDKADAAIASLQQTASYYTQLYQTLNANNTAGVNG